MNLNSYLIMVHMNQKKACVIGGGKVARRKVIKLLESGAKVTVVSPKLSAEMYDDLYAERLFKWINRSFQTEDVLDAFIVIAATDCKATNKFVANSCLTDQLLNIAHDKELGNFHVPASFSQGKLTISVGTSGASPMLAKKIKRELTQRYDFTYRGYL